MSNIQVNKDEKLEKSKIILIKFDFLGMAKDLRGRWHNNSHDQVLFKVRIDFSTF